MAKLNYFPILCCYFTAFGNICVNIKSFACIDAMHIDN